MPSYIIVAVTVPYCTQINNRVKYNTNKYIMISLVTFISILNYIETFYCGGYSKRREKIEVADVKQYFFVVKLCCYYNLW